MPQAKGTKVGAFLNHRMRITNSDTRVIVGAFLQCGRVVGSGSCRGCLFCCQRVFWI